MPSFVPSLGCLPAAFSNTALLTIAMMSATEQRLHLGDRLLAELGIDHVHVRGVAGEERGEVVAAARLRGDAGLLTVVQDRAEALAIGARHVDAGVDDEPGDALLVLGAQDAPLVGALDEPFRLADRVDPPQEAAEAQHRLGVLTERERTIVDFTPFPPPPPRPSPSKRHLTPT